MKKLIGLILVVLLLGAGEVLYGFEKVSPRTYVTICDVVEPIVTSIQYTEEEKSQGKKFQANSCLEARIDVVLEELNNPVLVQPETGEPEDTDGVGALDE